MRKTPKPRRISVQGDLYEATVLKVISKAVNGVPRTLELVQYEQTTTLEGGEEFIIAYVPETMLQGQL